MKRRMFGAVLVLAFLLAVLVCNQNLMAQESFSQLSVPNAPALADFAALSAPSQPSPPSVGTAGQLPANTCGN
jgi:hypothetical protein